MNKPARVRAEAGLTQKQEKRNEKGGDNTTPVNDDIYDHAASDS